MISKVLIRISKSVDLDLKSVDSDVEKCRFGSQISKSVVLDLKSVDSEPKSVDGSQKC